MWKEYSEFWSRLELELRLEGKFDEAVYCQERASQLLKYGYSYSSLHRGMISF